MQNHQTHKNAAGFTLIELVIAVAVIGILTSVAVLGYNQYKVRAYDAHSKQALRDVLLQCNAFWLDQDASQVCTHATVAEVYVASDEIVLKFTAEDLPDLPGGSQGNFCASAQHVSSPNPYSIDSASLISSGDNCSGAGGSVQTASVGQPPSKEENPYANQIECMKNAPKTIGVYNQTENHWKGRGCHLWPGDPEFWNEIGGCKWYCQKQVLHSWGWEYGLTIEGHPENVTRSGYTWNRERNDYNELLD